MHCSYVSFDIALIVTYSHSLVIVSYENDNNLVDPLKLNYIIKFSYHFTSVDSFAS